MKKLLLDENLPRPLKNHFSGEFEVTSVPDLGWQSKENGTLLAAMDEERIEILLTADQNLKFQQDLTKFGARVAVIRAFDIRLKALVPRILEIERAIRESDPKLRVIEIDLR
jgi:predicted nuclease of predicted toxin-antitoxin system